MELILLQDVDKLGKQGSVVNVKPGFARNYLIPQGLALNATAAARKDWETRQRQTQHKQDRLLQQAEELKQRLENLVLTLTLAVGAAQTAFGSVTIHDLLKALAKEGITLDKHAVRLSGSIKTLGSHHVPVRVHPGVTATLNVSVVPAAS